MVKVKEQFREADICFRLASVQFTTCSPQKIRQVGCVPLQSKQLYYGVPGRSRTVPFGPLDNRLGVTLDSDVCATCGKDLQNCVGHFGYLDLEMPVFHVGFFRLIISILQCLCKNCSCVMLKEEMKQQIRCQLMKPNLSYTHKKALYQKMVDKCKKTSVCPSCKYQNGLVKKLGGAPLKIVQIRPPGNQLEEFTGAMESSKELKAILRKCTATLLTPFDVESIFQHIPSEEVELLFMSPQLGHPLDLLLRRLPVPPLCIRPSVLSILKTGTTEDDLTMKLAEILFINDVLQKRLTSGARAQLVKEDWDYLQVQSALYLDSELSGLPANVAPKKFCRSLAQRLKGKHGRFRGNLSGKRVDFSARTVISPDPNLRIDEVGVPLAIAKILTYPERVSQWNIDMLRKLVKNGTDRYPGANFLVDGRTRLKKFLRYGNREILSRQLSVGDTVERHLMNGDIVLFNRQPSLHRLSIMAHFVRVMPFRTLRFNECVCTPYNADFDGDEMNLHFPQTEEAKTEARELMGVQCNLVTPRNGEPLIAATQDFITGAFLLTSKDTFLSREQLCQLICLFLGGKDSGMRVELPLPSILKPKRLWTGKQVFSLILRPNRKCQSLINITVKGRNYAGRFDLCPNDSYVVIRNSELLCGMIDKSTVGGGSKHNVFYLLFRDYGSQPSVDAMWRLSRITPVFLMNRGFSFGIGDVMPGKELLASKEELVGNGYRTCQHYIDQLEAGILKSQPGCTAEESLEALMLRELSAVRDRAGKACIQALSYNNSGLVMAVCGSKGSNINISQMIACVGQQAVSGRRPPDGFSHRSLPHFDRYERTPGARGFVESSFYSGLTPTEFFFHAMAGREGLVDTAVKTAETGYMQRRLVKCLEDLCVAYDGTIRTSTNELVQFKYGDDGLDPYYMEGKERVVDFVHLFEHTKVRYHSNNADEKLSPDDLKTLFDSKLRGASETLAAQFVRELTAFCNGVVQTVRSQYNVAECCAEHEDAGFTDACNKCQLKKDYRRQLLAAEGLNVEQATQFIDTCLARYRRALIEPGTAAGAIAATSIGEPSTQMTLKTFHFAGVASMNITQGVPRIKEIINAVKNIQTPIITAYLTTDNDEGFARRVKARIERSVLGDVTERVDEVYLPNACFVIIKLSWRRIKLLQLEVTLASVAESIVRTRLAVPVTSKNLHLVGESMICVSPPKSKKRSLRSVIHYLKSALLTVTIEGYSNIDRCVIHADEKKGDTYRLLIEGSNYLQVISTPGVEGTRTVINHPLQICRVLGIEAARSVIISEIMSTMANHGIGLDARHVMLLADLMTARGEVLGITRQGLAKMKESVLMLASFEKTMQHLYEAAYFGQKDPLKGVSESIIMGRQIPLGTGAFRILHRPCHLPKQTHKEHRLLFESDW